MNILFFHTRLYQITLSIWLETPIQTQHREVLLKNSAMVSFNNEKYLCEYREFISNCTRGGWTRWGRILLLYNLSLNYLQQKGSERILKSAFLSYTLRLVDQRRRYRGPQNRGWSCLSRAWVGSKMPTSAAHSNSTLLICCRELHVLPLQKIRRVVRSVP